jgi:hypothetical protein
VVALVRELGLDEVAVLAAIRRHVRVGTRDPPDAAPELDAVRELPREVARRLRVVPLSFGSAAGGRRSLEVALADPTDAVALAEIEHVTGCEVEPRLMPLAAVEELVEASYRHLVTEVMRRETQPRRSGRSRQPARVLREARRITATPPAADAEIALRHRALLELLVGKGVVTREEYEAEVERARESTALDD